MADEKTAYRYLEEIGLEPIEHRAIIVKYAPESDDLSSELKNFSSTEYYVLQMCKDELVLMRVLVWAVCTLEKEIALRLPYSSVRSVEVTDIGMSYRITIGTDTGTICLLAQIKELSELRSSGVCAGLMGVPGTWHKNNLDDTLQMLKSLQTAC